MRFVLLFLLVAFFAIPARADFDAGRAAYNKKEWREAILHLRPLAEKGDDRAMILLGNMYKEGYGVIRNDEEAFELYQRAALGHDNTEAMVAMASMYTSGLGVPRSVTTAKKIFERAALLGDQTGAFFYASILFRGNNHPADDLKPDLEAAYKWLKIAGKQKAYPKFTNAALEMATQMEQKHLNTEQVQRLSAEADVWRPLTAKELGPFSVPPPFSGTRIIVPKEIETQIEEEEKEALE